MIGSGGPKIGTSMNTRRRGTAARATSRPIRAVARGSPRVTTEPKVNNSTKTAAARPSASRAPPSAVATNCTAWPPTPTWSVSLFAHSAAASPPRCLWGRSRVRGARGGRHQLHGHLGADRCARATLDYYFARKDDTLAFVLQSLVDDIAPPVADPLASGRAPTPPLRPVHPPQPATP